MWSLATAALLIFVLAAGPLAAVETIAPVSAVSAATSAAPAEAPPAPSAFVAPDWMKGRTDLVTALRDVRVIKDIEYVPGASKMPLAHPEALDPQALVYIKAGGKTRALDLFFPPTVGEKMPVVVFFHGGPNRGTKEGWDPALVLLAHGYIVVSANYRLRGEAPFPAYIYDGKAVIRWLRAHAAEYKIDPDHIGIWGHSAGAFLVDWLGTTNGDKAFEGDEGNLQFSSSVQAACAWNGGVGPLDGNWPTTLKSLDANAKKAAPFLIMHGEKDKVVSISLAINLAAALVKDGVECTFIPVPDQGHGIGGPLLEQQVIAFFDRHLKPGTGTGLVETKELDK
jgi:acetyl esterase/lipase